MAKLRFGLVTSILLTFLTGLLLGAALIHRPIPNAPVELPPARQPWNPKDVLGLVGSLGIRAMAGHLESIPGVVVETDRTFAIALPARRNRVHYVLVPKKDIRDIGQSVERYMEAFRRSDHREVLALNAVFCDVFEMRGGKIQGSSAI